MPEEVVSFRRLERIEAKLDKLADAMSTMARIEERMERHYDGMNRLGERVDKLDLSVHELEKSVAGTSFVTTRIERVAWVILTALITASILWFKS